MSAHAQSPPVRLDGGNHHRDFEALEAQRITSPRIEAAYLTGLAEEGKPDP